MCILKSYNGGQLLPVGRHSTPVYIHGVHQTAAYLFGDIFSGHVYHLPLMILFLSYKGVTIVLVASREPMNCES